MAISAAIVWEVRTTGADTNGGGFKAGASGTDYSQQDSPQYALTGLANSGPSTVLSASAASNMVGNIAQVISGTNFTTGFFEILSVTPGVSIGFSTNNAGATICTGTATNGVINIGGALATIGQSLTNWVAQNTIYVKATANYTVTATLTLASGINDIGSVRPNQLIGYTTTRGDNGQPTVTTSTNSLALMTVAMCNVHVRNFILDCNSTTTSIGLKVTAANSSRGLQITNVKAMNFTGKGFSEEGSTNLSGAFYHRCWATGGTSAASAGFLLTSEYATLSACVASSNSCHGFGYSSNCGATFLRCVSEKNKTGGTYRGFNLDAPLGNTVLDGCIAYDNSGDGIGMPGTYQSVSVLNSLLISNGGYGINFGVNQPLVEQTIDYNGFYNNTSGARNNYQAGVHDVTLTGDPFVDAANGNFALNATAAAGAAARAAGYPGLLPNGTTTGYLDMGAAQHQDPAGGTNVFVLLD